MTHLASDRERTALLCLVGNDRVRAWLNGRLVFDGDQPHRYHTGPEFLAPVTLRAGRNTLLVRASRGSSDYHSLRLSGRRLRTGSRVPPRRTRPLAGSRRSLRSGRGARSDPSSLAQGPPRRASRRAGRWRPLPPRRVAAGRLRRPGWCRSLQRGPGGWPDAQHADRPRSSHRARRPGHHRPSGRGVAKDRARPGLLPCRALPRGPRPPGGRHPRRPQPRGADPGDGPLAGRREGRGPQVARPRRRPVRNPGAAIVRPAAGPRRRAGGSTARHSSPCAGRPMRSSTARSPTTRPRWRRSGPSWAVGSTTATRPPGPTTWPCGSSRATSATAARWPPG